jgi:membrane fusion protein, multidrug efflux system
MHMTRMIRALCALLAVSMIAPAGCGRRQQAKSAPPSRGAVMAESGVGVTPAIVGTVTRRVPVTGSIASLRDVALSAKLSGRVVEVTVREGDAVKTGQVLVRLDPTDLRTQIRSAEAGMLCSTNRSPPSGDGARRSPS